MVDFAKILQEREANMTPEQREKVVLRRKQEERFNKTAKETTGRWVMKHYKTERPKVSLIPGSRKARPERVEYVFSDQIKPVTIRIEESTDYKDRKVANINFMGDMPTHIAYNLDKHFMDELMKESKNGEDMWALCCGTTGRYPEITIPCEVIKNYIREVIPSLMDDHNLSADQILNEAFNENPAPAMSM